MKISGNGRVQTLMAMPSRINEELLKILRINFVSFLVIFGRGGHPSRSRQELFLKIKLQRYCFEIVAIDAFTLPCPVLLNTKLPFTL